MSLVLLFHHLLLSIFRSLRLIVDLFHGLYCSGSMCVGVAVWFGWGGVVSLCMLLPGPLFSLEFPHYITLQFHSTGSGLYFPSFCSNRKLISIFMIVSWILSWDI